MKDTIIKPSAKLRMFIKQFFKIFNELDFDQRRPLSFLLWVMQDRNLSQDIYDKFSAKNISFENIKNDLTDILHIHNFLRCCCGNEFIYLARIIDIIYFRDESPLRIAKADFDIRLRDFENTIFQSGDYKKKVFCHIYNMGSIESPIEPIFGNYKLEILNPYELPLLIGESSLFSSLHPFEAVSFFLAKEDEIPCTSEEINSFITTSWQEAVFYIQPLKYLKDSPIGLDYITLLFYPFWLNSIRREGICLYGKPLIPISNNLFDLTKDDMEFIKKWQYLYNIPKVKAKMSKEYMLSQGIPIPDTRKTIDIAGTYYENYMMREDLADKFTLLIFALEALFSTGIESTYKICMHSSTLLSDYGPQRKEIYTFIKDMLAKRNAYIHGRKLFYELDVDINQIWKLASYVRLSIRSYISLYLRGRTKRNLILDELEILALGQKPYGSFEKEKDIELLDEMIEENP